MEFSATRDAEILAKEAFEVTGTEVKAVRFSLDYFDYNFYSYQEEWEKHIQLLENIPNRFFIAKHKIEGERILLYTTEVRPAYKEFGIDKEKFEERVERIPIFIRIQALY